MDQLVFWKQFLELSWAEPIFLILFRHLFLRQIEFLPLDLPGKKRVHSLILLSANRILAVVPSWKKRDIFVDFADVHHALGIVWGCPGTLWARSGTLWGHSGTFWGRTGTLWGRLGETPGRSGDALGCSWDALGRSGDALGRSGTLWGRSGNAV